MNETKDYTQWAKEIFQSDNFATKVTGVEIEKVDKHYAICKMKIEDKHYNARNLVMGGAIFTLADLTFAVAATSGEMKVDVVTVSSSINYINRAKGDTLFAEALCVKDGRTICVYDVMIKDNLGNKIAKAVITGMKTL